METGWSYVLRRLLFIFIIIILCLIALLAGLMLGYAIIGDGESVWTIVSPAKWQELIGKFTGN